MNKKILIGITIAMILVMSGRVSAPDVNRPMAESGGGGSANTGSTSAPAGGTSGVTPSPIGVPSAPQPPPASTETQPEPITRGIGGQTTPARGEAPLSSPLYRYYSRGVGGTVTFLAAYDQYSGFARLGSLFMTSDMWEKHRENVNRAFCDTILLGGTQCWISRICDTQLYRNMPSSVFAGRTPSGQMVATASIQGEKSLPIAAVDEQGMPVDMRKYKVTYAIRNPYDEQKIKYNIQFRTEDGNTYNWYNEWQSLSPGTYAGTSAKIAEDTPLLDYGTKDYKTVCIIFSPAIVDYHTYAGRRIKEWCSDVVQYMGTATRPYPEAADDTTVTPDPNAGQPPTVTTVPTGRPGF